MHPFRLSTKDKKKLGRREKWMRVLVRDSGQMGEGGPCTREKEREGETVVT